VAKRAKILLPPVRHLLRWSIFELVFALISLSFSEECKKNGEKTGLRPRPPIRSLTLACFSLHVISSGIEYSHLELL